MDALQENNELKARLRAFAAIMRLTRDSLAQSSLEATAVHIVNNARPLLNYDRSAMLDLRGYRPRVIGEFAQVEINQHTEYASALRDLCHELRTEETQVVLDANSPLREKKSAKWNRALDYLTSGENQEHTLLIVPLRSSRFKNSAKEPFFWVLEYNHAVPPHVSASIALLVTEFGTALWGHVRGGRVGNFLRFFRKITAMKVFAAILVIFLIALFTVNVDHTISAEFVVRPQSVYSSCAWFDCVVKKCYVADGQHVKAGDKIVEYDTDRMRFQLTAAQAAYQESNAEYEQESKASFTEKERLGKLKILACKREQAQIAIREALWYLDHSVIRANVSGVVALADGSADKLSGRALRLGEHLFDILSDKEMVAEIMVNEKDASVLERNPKITLFLHTRPELPIPVKIISLRYYPELTEQNIYSYNVKVEMEKGVAGLRYGMRGVARVTGENVKLGYYLFRSLVLWYRGL